MGAPEKKIIDDILSSLDPSTERLFRINAGVGWTGKIIKRTMDAIVLGAPRILRAAPEGWPDLFGWKTITITPDMVGLKIAVVRAVEVKANDDRLRTAQAKFKQLIESMGGIFEISH
jgi:hypothetical protein